MRVACAACRACAWSTPCTLSRRRRIVRASMTTLATAAHAATALTHARRCNSSSSSSSSSVAHTHDDAAAATNAKDKHTSENKHTSEDKHKDKHDDDADKSSCSDDVTTSTSTTPPVMRWEQPAYVDTDALPIVDEAGRYIVSRVQWPTGPLAYVTPPPTDDKLAPRFGYQVVQVKKYESWWKYNQRHPRLSLAYVNIQVLFLLGVAWLVALLTTEYRRTSDALRTPAAMAGEHRGRGPATSQTQKIHFRADEVDALMARAQNDWLDGVAEANYIGSKDYQMKKIPRPRELTFDDVRKR